MIANSEKSINQLITGFQNVINRSDGSGKVIMNTQELQAIYDLLQQLRMNVQPPNSWYRRH